MKAMILAAGLGTRLRPYSRHTPKALFTINERPVLAIVIEKLQTAGFDAVIINTHHHHRQIEDFIAQTTFAIPVRTRHEADILGTGGAIRNVADFWENDSLMVINADIVSDIDPAEVYDFHQSHPHPITMVMHDHAQFNGVHVDAKDFITGFRGGPRSRGTRKLAFTGIHVLDRRVLDFLPPQGPAHIIDAYVKMIAAEEGIKAKVVQGHRWYDIGTPQSYQTAVYDHMAPLAFETAMGQRPGETIQKETLQGDGSDRRWYRLRHGTQSLVMVDHGIRTHPHTQTQEVDAYISIGRHLATHNVAVPRIYAHDRNAGLVFTQDLGDTHLQAIIKADDPVQIRHRYEPVLDQWAMMAVETKKGFDTKWTYQTSHYDTRVVLKNECRYFTEAFLQGYLQWEISYQELQTEYEQLAEGIRETAVTGFIHRDFQSRNIMVQNERTYIIDYQGGRIGPIQYDLASLLIDPYADLPQPLQSQLLNYAVEKLKDYLDFEENRFTAGYRLCTVSRNLQILGAFAFLSQTKGKKQFEPYIPKAAKSLGRNLSCLKELSLPKLEKLSEKIIEKTK